MSSLAAVQADGYYYPPDWTPDGGSASLRARVGTKGAKGALGKKNAKLKPKQPTVRFEMPFDVGCSRCDATIAKGVRFNAAKTAVGKYHSTTVWRFEMKTACCGNRLEIRTDPKNGDFALEAGARRRLGGAAAGTTRTTGSTAFGTKPASVEGTIEVEVHTREDRELLMADGMARLERAAAISAERRADDEGEALFGAEKGAGERELSPGAKRRRVHQNDSFQDDHRDGYSRLTVARHARLRERTEETRRDDYDANRELRRAHRAERNRVARNAAERDALGLPESVTLLPRHEDDAETARRAFRGGRGGAEAEPFAPPEDVRGGESKEDDDDANEKRRKKGDATSFDAFERARARRRATIRESSIFSGPGSVARVTAARSPRRAPNENKDTRRDAADGELFGIFSSPRTGARGKGYVPTPSAAARAGGARGVQVRHALVVAQRTSPRKTKGASNRARAAALAGRSARSRVGLAALPSFEYG